MRIIHHERSPKIAEMTLAANPMRVFVTKTVELRIEKGDRLRTVADAVAPLLPKGVKAGPLVALWFAMGERVAKKKLDADWSQKELYPDSDRRYLSGR
jgi:hypothetical protein